jgi:hypothetical protein
MLYSIARRLALAFPPISALKAKSDALKAQCDALKDESDAFKAQCEVLKAECDALKAQCEVLKAQCDRLRASHRDLVARFLALLDKPLPELGTEEFTHFVNALQPWYLRFEKEGYVFGGNIVPDTRRVATFARFISQFPKPIHNVLELGSHEGGHSLQLSAIEGIDKVIALEGRIDNVARAKLIYHVFEARKVDLRYYDIEELNVADFSESIDAVFCSGMLYHLKKPWDLIKKLDQLGAKLLFIDTHYAASGEVFLEGFSGSWFNEGFDPLSGLSERSFWLTAKDLMKLLYEYGFIIRFFHDIPDHVFGPRAWIVAEKNEDLVTNV